MTRRELLVIVIFVVISDVKKAQSLPDERNQSAEKRQEIQHRHSDDSGLSFLREQVQHGDDLLKRKV
jgi:hypothetical protein